MAKGKSILGMFSTVMSFKEYGLNVTTTAIRHHQVQALMNSNLKFDVIIMGFVESAALIGLSHVFNAPVVITSTIKLNPFSSEQYSGALAHDSFVSNAMLPFTDEMTFVQRIANTLVNFFGRTVSKLMLYMQVIGVILLQFVQKKNLSNKFYSIGKSLR